MNDKSNSARMLNSAILFCTRIDAYITAFNLNPVKVQAFKSNRQVFEFARKNSKQLARFGRNSINDAIATFESSFADLVDACKANPSYTVEIGRKLGIE